MLDSSLATKTVVAINLVVNISYTYFAMEVDRKSMWHCRCYLK